MIDECKNCSLMGDLKKCKVVLCSKHENWYAQALEAEIKALVYGLKELISQDYKDEWGMGIVHVKDIKQLLKENG